MSETENMQIPPTTEEMVAMLKDPNIVHVNMLRGYIAMPSTSQIRHLYGNALDDAVNTAFAAFREDNARLERELAAAMEDATRRRKDKHRALAERNKLVLALAKLFPSGLRKTDIEGWDTEWHWCVTIDLPTGQVSWHIRDSEKPMFDWLPPYEKPWDGHDTEEKYRRLEALKGGAR